MSRFYLRYRGRDLPLPEGEFLIGRSSDCGLVLSDPLVSRHHALLRIDASSVVAWDLGSRNGLLVNERPITGPVHLGEGDTLVVGTKQLTLLEENGELELDSDAEVPPTIPDAYAQQSTHPPPIEPFGDAFDAVPQELSETLFVSSRVLLVDVVNRALSMGRIADAERVLSSVFEDLSAATQRGELISHDTLQKLADTTFRVCGQSVGEHWLNCLFSLYTETGQLIDGRSLDAFEGLVRRIQYEGRPIFESYVHTMHRRAGSFSPGERSVLHRLDGVAATIGL